MSPTSSQGNNLADWPFQNIAPAAYWALSDEDRALVESYGLHPDGRVTAQEAWRMTALRCITF